ncbi:MAG TPA: M36 family metallopeptidase [Conexibacter sp.]|nr:M36 family metallopeptidase [Conexibacter sp.]
MRGMLATAMAVGMFAATAVPAAAVQAGTPAGARRQLDVRDGVRTPVPEDVRDARHELTQRLGIEAHVGTDPVGGGIRVLDRTDGFLSGPRAGDPADSALAYVRAHADVFGLSDADLAALRLSDRSTSNDGVTHLTWVPESGGVPAYDSALRVHVAQDGSVAAASGPPLGGVAVASARPQLTASQALAIAQTDVGAPVALPRSTTRPGPQRLTAFANGDRARLVVFDTPTGDRLAWRITVAGRDPYVYDEVIDAGTGSVLARHSLTDFAVSRADVFPYHPDAAAGGAEVEVDIGPWLDASATTLTGPNAHAYADVNDDDVADAGEEVGPSSGTDWLYPVQPVAPGSGVGCAPWSFCTWGGTAATLGSEATNRRHATTQLFALVNTFHDWLAGAPFDFTSGSGSFDSGDPSNPDPLEAQADDAIPDGPTHFVDNANMSTPPDGLSPTMQMYLWTNPAVNGSDDASIVFHEYTHGLSNRLIGDGGGLNAKQSGAMGEGWSDWYAMDYLVQQGYAPDTAADGEVVLGEYATGDTAAGIRHQPLDCAVGSSAPACGGSTLAGHDGGFTFADLGHVGGDNATTPSFEVHDDGEIWSETLWDLRTALGAPVARRLVTNAMRLSPLDPSFLEGRDAILLADETGFGGAHRDAIWQVFAARGMGYGARSASADATSATASFSATPVLATATTVADPAPLGDGDGVAEPGESVSLSLTLHDPSTVVDLTNVAATLTTSSPGVQVGAAPVSWGTIAAGGSVVSPTPFAVTVPVATQCGGEVPLTLHVTSDQGSVDLPVQLALGSGGDAVFATAPNLKLAIPESATAPVSSILNVPTAGHVRHLRVTLNVTHGWVGDLRARLTSPSGTTIDLFQRPGLGELGSGLSWEANPVIFDDAAAPSIQDLPDGFGTLTGTFSPDEPLARFAGEQRAGSWLLQMSDSFDDDAPANERMLHSWSIETDEPTCTTPAGGGGGGGGGAAGGPGGGGGNSGASGGQSPPVVASLSRSSRKATLSRRGTFAFAFLATPRLRGRIAFTIPRHGRAKPMSFGSRSFTVPRSGRVRLTTTVRGRALAQLRRRHTVRVTVTIALGGTTFTRKLTLTAPKPRRRHRF